MSTLTNKQRVRFEIESLCLFVDGTRTYRSEGRADWEQHKWSGESFLALEYVPGDEDQRDIVQRVYTTEGEVPGGPVKVALGCVKRHTTWDFDFCVSASENDKRASFSNGPAMCVRLLKSEEGLDDVERLGRWHDSRAAATRSSAPNAG